MNNVTKRLLISAAVLIIAGAAVVGIGRAIVQNTEGSYTMENQSYAITDVKRIQINTDSPSVVIKPSPGNEIHLTWQTGDTVEYQAQLTNGQLTIDYRVNGNWLKTLLLASLVKHDYVLEVELPDGYMGGIAVHTASGSIAADTAAAVDEFDLKSVSGSNDAMHITSQKGIGIRTTSGGVSADSLHAEGDIHFQTVSGSVQIRQSGTFAGIDIRTVSGGVSMTELNAVDGVHAKTTSARIDISQLQCDTGVTLDSTSGALRLDDVACEAFTAKTVSGSIDFQDLTAGAIEVKSTSGTIHGTVAGAHGDYSVTVKTVSGSNNLQNTDAGKAKTLKIDTVSGSIDVGFSGDARK